MGVSNRSRDTGGASCTKLEPKWLRIVRSPINDHDRQSIDLDAGSDITRAHDMTCRV